MTRLLGEEEIEKVRDFMKNKSLNKEGRYEVSAEDYTKLEKLYRIKPIDGFTGMVYGGNAIVRSLSKSHEGV